MVNTDVVVIDGVEIVGRELAKQHLRLEVDYNDEDMLIDIAIASAISSAENYTERILRKSLLILNVHNPEPIVVERISLNDKVQKVEIMEECVESIILPGSSFYQIKRGPEFYEIGFKDVDLKVNQSLKITIELGFDSNTIPKDIMSALLLSVGDAYEKREDRNQGSNTAVNNLLRPYRKWQ